MSVGGSIIFFSAFLALMAAVVAPGDHPVAVGVAFIVMILTVIYNALDGT